MMTAGAGRRSGWGAISCLALLAAVVAAPVHAADQPLEWDFLIETNWERQRRGLPRLQMATKAVAVARSWSDRMKSVSKLHHNPNLARDFNAKVTTTWTVLGENVGVGPSASSLHQAFMNSDGHRRNILDSRYRYVGIGVTHDGSRLWVTVNFFVCSERMGTDRGPQGPWHPMGSSRIGANAAVGDFDGDGIDDVATMLRAKRPLVRIQRGNGATIARFMAFPDTWNGGDVAAGDVDGDGRAELIVGAGRGHPPLVRIYRISPSVSLLKSFYAYSTSFKGGVRVSAGDIDGDGRAEIVTGAGVGGGPHVKVFDRSGRARRSFFGLNKDFRGGIDVAAGDFDRDGRAEIVVAPLSKKAPRIVVWDVDGSARRGRTIDVYELSWSAGLRVSAGMPKDGRATILVGPAYASGSATRGPEVKRFDASGALIQRWFPIHRHAIGGVDVAAGRSRLFTVTHAWRTWAKWSR